MDRDAMQKASAVEEDGCSSALFSYLWAKQDGSGFKVSIPDTLVYKSRLLDAWYFTSATSGPDKGTVKKRGPNYLNNDAILEFFKERGTEGVDVVATLIELREDESRLVRTGGATCEYLTFEGLKDFLLSRKKPLAGIVQKFILPKGGYNNLLRATWSPSQIFLLDRRTCHVPLYDSKAPLLDRVVTYDGAPHQSTEEPVRGDILPATVRSLCDNLASHVHAVTHGYAAINRLVLLFKLSGDGKLWLLYASSVRLDPMVAGQKASALRHSLSMPAVPSGSSLGGAVAAGGSTPPKAHHHHHGGSPGAAGVDAQPSVAMSVHTGITAHSAASSPTKLLKEALRRPQDAPSASRRGAVNLTGTPVARLTVKGNTGSGNERLASLETLAEEATAVEDEAHRGSDYLARKAALTSPMDDYDHSIPNVDLTSHCPSCGRRRAGEQLVVPNVAILKHYDSLCRLVGVEPYLEQSRTAGVGADGRYNVRALAAISPKQFNYWPPASVVLAISSGVGVYGAFPPGTIDAGGGGPGQARGSISASRTQLRLRSEPVDASGQPRRLLVTEVPPTLLVANPKLRASTYRSFKSDALWLAKTVPVCDACYVGFTTLQVAMMGGRDADAALLELAGPAGLRERNKMKFKGSLEARAAAAGESYATLPEEGSIEVRPTGSPGRRAGATRPRAPSPDPLKSFTGLDGLGDEDRLGTPLLAINDSTPASTPGSRTPGTGTGTRSGAGQHVDREAREMAEIRAGDITPRSPVAASSRAPGPSAGVDAPSSQPRAPDEAEWKPRAKVEVVVIPADKWEVDDFPQPGPGSGLLAAGLAHYGKRTYMCVVRRAAYWETAGISWRLEPELNELVEVAQSKGEEVLPEDLHFAVYMRSARSGRATLMFIRGPELSVSSNPVLMRAALVFRSLGAAEGNSVGSSFAGATDDKVGSVVMQGLYAMPEPGAPVDFCVLTTEPVTARRRKVRGEVQFRLRCTRIGGNHRVDIGPAPFPELVEQARSLGVAYDQLIYAAKSRLAYCCTKAEESYDGKVLLHAVREDAMEPHLVAYASQPVPGSVLRLVPGHFLAGMASLDRYRGWGTDQIAVPSSRSAAAKLLHAAGKPQKSHRKSTLAMSRRERAEADFNERMLKKADPTLGLSVAQVAGTLEAVMDLPQVQVQEVAYTKALPKLNMGTLARALLVLPDGATVLVVLSMADTTGGENPSIDGDASRMESLQSVGGNSGFLMRVYSLDTGALNWSTFVPESKLQLPVTDPTATAVFKLQPAWHQDPPKCPGNPFLQVSALEALHDVPRAPGEFLLAAKVVTGGYCQRFVGHRDMGSVYQAQHDPWGLHPGVSTGGNYVLSLSAIHHDSEESFDDVDSLTPIAPDLRSRRAEAMDKQHAAAAIAANGSSTSTVMEAAGSSALSARPSSSTPRPVQRSSEAAPAARPLAIKFIVRCQYLRHPLPLYEPHDTHDDKAARVASAASRVLKTSHMLQVETETWVRTGAMPSPATLVALSNERDRVSAAIANSAMTRVRACQTACEPVYEYRLGLEELRRADLNPFQDLLGAVAGNVNA